MTSKTIAELAGCLSRYISRNEETLLKSIRFNDNVHRGRSRQKCGKQSEVPAWSTGIAPKINPVVSFSGLHNSR